MVKGGLAQLARALDLHSRGHRFDSDILHYMIKVLIIATPRSGSTTLLNSISKAYGITGYYEPFGSEARAKKYDFNWRSCY